MAVDVKFSPWGNQQFVDESGNPAVGWYIETYIAGSSTRQATYTDATGTTAQSADITLNALGFPESGQIWLIAGSPYKFKLYNAAGVLKDTVDNISGVNDSSETTDQWVSSGVTPTYINATTFTLVGDQTTDFHVGRKGQFTTTAGTVYGELATSVYSTLTTVTVALDVGQVLDSGLSAVNLSILRNDHLATPRGACDPINYFVNGGCQVAQIAAVNLSTTAQYGAVDNVMAWASAGAVSAGTIAQNTASGIGITGNSFKLAGITLTGSGVLSVRIRIESKDAVKLKNIASSAAVLVSHDVGSAVNYTVIVRKPTVADNYTATTVISTGSAVSVPTGISSATWLKSENIAMADCSNGIEVEYQIACGAITTKNFEFTEFQVGRGATAVAIPLKLYEEEFAACQRYLPTFSSSAANSIIAGGMCGSTTNAYCDFIFNVPPRVPPTGITNSAASQFSVWNSGTVPIACTALAFSSASAQGCTLNPSVASGLVAGDATRLFANSATATQIIFNGCRL